MGTSEKQGLPKPPKIAMRKDGVPVNVTPLRDDTFAATQAFVPGQPEGPAVEGTTEKPTARRQEGRAR